MRLFIAISLPLTLKEKLEQTIKVFQKCELDARWVEPKNIHMTLKFLGEVCEEKLEEIKKNIQEVAAQYKSLEANLTDFSFFPNENYVRVFFVATDKEEILKNIADNLEKKLEKIGFPKEGRFKTHITLARVRTKKNIDRLKKEIKCVELKEKFSVSEITLFKSTLTASGPIYEAIFKASLAT
ncbi:MAG: RNA 2',3'-cyclic phosphodiesterase [Candidatus Omnitrophota bacterium]|nr:RNA 2',3'-cyclic phosphodiesterase [Candidatus Omnitrophota bacterium]